MGDWNDDGGWNSEDDEWNNSGIKTSFQQLSVNDELKSDKHYHEKGKNGL